MLTDAHHEWIFKFTGIKSSAPPPSQGEAPSLSAVPQGGGDQQSRAFMAQFNPVVAAIDADLAYTADHAPADQHKQRVTKRETLVQACAAALRTIDPADEAKAKPGLDKTLAGANGLRGEVGKFRQAAEKAFNDWTSRTANYDDMAHKLEEMETWGHPKAGALNQPVADVAAKADGRHFAEACAAYDKLPGQFKPIWDDYTQQKEAQAKYEPARAAINPRLQASQTSEFKKLATQQTQFPPAISTMDGAVKAKNYVNALKIEGETEAKLTAYETALADLRAKKQAYEGALALAQPRLDQAAQRADYKAMRPMKAELDKLKQQMQKSADGEEFEAAQHTAEDLGTKADQYNAAADQLEKEKKDYEDAAAKLVPRAEAAAKVTFKALQEALKAIGTLRATMEKAAAAEDFAGALNDADSLKEKLDAFEEQQKQIEEQKKAYEDAYAGAESKVAAVGNPSCKKLVNDEKDIADKWKIAADTAKEENYETATQMVTDVAALADTYADNVKQIEEKKKAFEDAWTPAKNRVDAFNETRVDSLAPMQQAILEHVKEIEKLAADESYDEAINSTAALTRELDDYEKSDDAQIWVVEYKGKKYAGTKKELVAVQAMIRAAAIKEAMPPLKNHAQYHEGYYNDLKALNDQQYIVGWVVSAVGGANLGALGSAVSAQNQAISSAQAAIQADPASAQGAYDAARNAVNDAGKALTTYLDAIDFGGKVVIKALETTEVVCFAVAAACGGAILAPAGSTIGTVMLANGIAGGGFAGLEEAAKQAGGAMTGIDAPKSVGDALGKIGKATIVNGVTGALSAGIAKKLNPKICGIIFQRLGIADAAAKKTIEDFVENASGNAIQTIVTGAPDVWSGQKTWDDLAVAVAQSMIGGGLGGIAGGKLKPGVSSGPGTMKAVGAGVLGVATLADADSPPPH